MGTVYLRGHKAIDNWSVVVLYKTITALPNKWILKDLKTQWTIHDNHISLENHTQE